MFIVDDNPWDRKGIASMMNYAELGIERILTFEDGEEAFEAVRESPPDIILTDVAMPRLNGLQLTERLLRAYPQIKVIFMSCYSEFEYIKSALDMNSAGYILKPVESAELRKVVERTVSAINRERDNQLMVSRLIEKADSGKLREQFVVDFIFDSAGDEAALRARFAEYGLSLPERPGICLISVAADKRIAETENDSLDPARYALYKELENVFREISGERERAVVVSASYTEFIVFCVIDLASRAPDGFSASAVDMLQKLPDKFLSRVCAGVSAVSGRLADASGLYQQSIQAKENVFFGDSKLAIYGEGDGLSGERAGSDPNGAPARVGKRETGRNLYADLKKLLSTGREEELQAFLDNYLRKTDFWQNEPYMKNIAFMIVTLARFIIQSNGAYPFDSGQAYGYENGIREFWREIDSIQTMRDLRKYLWEALLPHTNGPAQGGNSRKAAVAEQIKKSIRANYGRHLTVKDIAQEVNFSSIYINNLFKQETGKTIFEYLTQVRMEKAMELLKNPDSKIYMVADEVGITNKSHFCLAFKRHTGLSPSEYKNKVKF